MAPVVCQNSLKDLVENFTPGGCYGIEWKLSGDKLKCKDYYNPQWRIDGVKAKGLRGLYTDSSKHFEFAVGQGLVGMTFAKQEVLFVTDLQVIGEETLKDCIQLGDTTAFLRADLAKEYDLHSVIFLPLQDGVLEVGSASFVTALPSYFAPYACSTTPPLADSPPAAKRAKHANGSPMTPHPFLPQLVENLCRVGCYGIEWALDGDMLKYRSHFNPEWRLEGIRRQGLKGAYTTKSIGYTFAVGEGLVGLAFAKQAPLFIKDVQSITPEEVEASMQGSSVAFIRAEIAREFGIHSVLFLPSADGVWEVGSIQTVDDLQAFLSEPAAQAATVALGRSAKELLDALQALVA